MKLGQTEAEKFLVFLHEAEKLKSVLRHSWLSSGRRESTAEHTWRMAVMAMLLHGRIKNKPDLLKTLKMVLVHDIVEVYAGDVAAWKKNKLGKNKLEWAAAKKLSGLLPGKQGIELKNLWREFEAGRTPASRFAQALDKLEAKLQHQEGSFKRVNKLEIRYNLMGGKKECEYDPFLQELWQSWTNNWLKIYKKHKVSKSLYA